MKTKAEANHTEESENKQHLKPFFLGVFVYDLQIKFQ